MYSILIIEDDPAYLCVMESFLQMEGFDVRSASSGQSGLAMLREMRPSLVLCDIMMPEMDGLEVLKVMKGEEELAGIPLIFITALGEYADIRRGMVAGADDYLSKPFSSDELLAAIIARIDRHVMKKQDTSIVQEQLAELQEKITIRELEVLKIVGQGVTSKEIAKRLGVSLRTVEAHRSSLMNKLGAANAASLARWALVAEQLKG